MPESQDCFIPLDFKEFDLPSLFTFPFYYEVNPMAQVAADALQDYLLKQTDWKHNFGFDAEDNSMVIGKMFGVLVVQKIDGSLGFLAAFSGKLAESNTHPYFVPPVYDMLQTDGFFKPEEEVLNALNDKLKNLESDSNYLEKKAIWIATQEQIKFETDQERQKLKDSKNARKHLRNAQASVLTEQDFILLQEELKDQSLKEQYFFKRFIADKDTELHRVKSDFDFYEDQIIAIKLERKFKSKDLQDRLFDQYRFLNAKDEYKSLKTIFINELNIIPPAGAGECAAPKLLHYAFSHRLKPIALAEFWWGQSPKSEIRKHKEFYPACRSKCEPILNFMLQGLEVEPNPMLTNPAEGKVIETVFEDDYLILVNKPDEFLSVPGKNIKDSVQSRMQALYPESILVHRLDQSTSGLLLVAKNKDIHQNLQAQFINRTVKKRYLALLDAKINVSEGIIDLPLRVDLDNRPHQLVCYEHGKTAQTLYKVISSTASTTRIALTPITGRTHQLRVHCAHPLGLNAPIMGDDLYGTKKTRLHLHAEFLEFTHPISNERLSFELKAPF